MMSLVDGFLNLPQPRETGLVGEKHCFIVDINEDHLDRLKSTYPTNMTIFGIWLANIQQGSDETEVSP